MKTRVVLKLGTDEQLMVAVEDLRSKPRLAKAIAAARRRQAKRRAAGAAAADPKPLWF
jgi:hypothetical protein